MIVLPIIVIVIFILLFIGYFFMGSLYEQKKRHMFSKGFLLVRFYLKSDDMIEGFVTKGVFNKLSQGQYKGSFTVICQTSDNHILLKPYDIHSIEVMENPFVE